MDETSSELLHFALPFFFYSNTIQFLSVGNDANTVLPYATLSYALHPPHWT